MLYKLWQGHHIECMGLSIKFNATLPNYSEKVKCLKQTENILPQLFLCVCVTSVGLAETLGQRG